MTSAPTLAVVVKGWPRLSETFIAQELVALEEAGHDMVLWSLRHPTDTATHPLHDRLKADVKYLPEYLHDERTRVLRGYLKARRLPGFRAAWKAWRADLAAFSKQTRFVGLTILMAAGEVVTFEAGLTQSGHDASFVERSTFKQHEGQWKYLEGEPG